MTGTRREETRSTTGETLLELYAAVNGADTETASSILAEDVSWIEPGDGHAGEDAAGPDAVLEAVFSPALEETAFVQAVPRRVFDANGATVVEGAFVGTMADGSPFDVPFAHVFDVEDGVVRRVTSYEDVAVDDDLESLDHQSAQ